MAVHFTLLFLPNRAHVHLGLCQRHTGQQEEFRRGLPESAAVRVQKGERRFNFLAICKCPRNSSSTVFVRPDPGRTHGPARLPWITPDSGCWLINQPALCWGGCVMLLSWQMGAQKFPIWKLHVFLVFFTA